MKRARVVPVEMKQTLNLLRMKASRGDERALEELIRLLTPRIPRYQMFDQSGLHTQDDIEALKAHAVCMAVRDFPTKGKGMDFETFAITAMKWHVLSTIQYRKEHPKMDYPDQNDMIDLVGVCQPFQSTPDPRLGIVRTRFEAALRQQAKQLMIPVYEALRECPWLTIEDLATRFSCSTTYIRYQLQRIYTLLKEVLKQIIDSFRQFGINLEGI